MRLDLRVGTIAAAAGLCLPMVAYGQRPVVEGMSQRLTVACGTEGAKVQGMGNTVTLTGTCATVLVEGSDNTVHIATLGKLTVAGMNNKVYWTAGIDGAAPKITKEGIGNTVAKQTPADAEAPVARPQTTTPSTALGRDNASPTRTKAPPITRVTSGPAVAMRNSAPAEGNDPLNRETPPNSQSVIPLISIPSRRATTACPSSCNSRDAKNRTVATTPIAT